MEQIIQFPQLSGIIRYSSEFGRLDNDYIFSRLSPGNRNIDLLNDPIRFSGLTICLILKGEIQGELNLEEFTLSKDSLLVINENSIVRITHVDWSEIDAYVLFISQQFLSDLNIDLNAIDLKTIVQKPKLAFSSLGPSQAETMARYIDLLHINAVQNSFPNIKRSIARSILQAILYQLVHFYKESIASDGVKHTEGKKRMSRRLNYVHEFMVLVRQHHTRQRSIGFYADRLYISSKYLSHIIKDITGRSAADWIDQFVILEAKNLLRFSNKNIQQIAYALNFSTQSSFGKYFKHITGMSPTQYQKA